MKCPYCGAEESKVIDSRPTEDNERIRRRRECLSCHMRFTTYEVVETVPLVVVKKDSSREPFDRQKLLNAMVRACAKRPVSYESLERAVSSIEQTLLSSYDREIPSVRIGELTMQELKKIDEVAYVRFASVYRQFADVESFFNELQKLKGLLRGVHLQMPVRRPQGCFQFGEISRAQQVVHAGAHSVAAVGTVGKGLPCGGVVLGTDSVDGGIQLHRNGVGEFLHLKAAVKGNGQQCRHDDNTGVNAFHVLTSLESRRDGGFLFSAGNNPRSHCR